MERSEKQDPCFVPLAGMNLVFEPGCKSGFSAKKYPCPDCFHCQACSESRCQSCKGGKNRKDGGKLKKLSLREQIRLFDEINAKGIKS